jgi:hypothetical protein
MVWVPPNQRIVSQLMRMRVEMKDERTHDLFYETAKWDQPMPIEEWVRLQMAETSAVVIFPVDKDGNLLVVRRDEISAILLGSPRGGGGR